MVFAWFFSGFPLKQWNNAMKLVSKVHEVLLCVGNQLGQKSLGCLGGAGIPCLIGPISHSKKKKGSK